MRSKAHRRAILIEKPTNELTIVSMAEPPIVIHHASCFQQGRRGTYIRWYLRYICAHKEESLLIDLFKAMVRSSAVTNRILFSEKTYFSSCVRYMFSVTI